MNLTSVALLTLRSKDNHHKRNHVEDSSNKQRSKIECL